MNFIFYNDEDQERLWRHLYFLLPHVLMHALFVVRALFKTLAPEFQLGDTVTDLWLMAGLLLSHELAGGDEPSDTAACVFNEIFTKARIDCPYCGTRLDFGGANLRRFWDRGDIRCRRCGVVLSLLQPSHVAGDDV